jgi:hypothetical protein
MTDKQGRPDIVEPCRYGTPGAAVALHKPRGHSVRHQLPHGYVFLALSEAAGPF